MGRVCSARWSFPITLSHWFVHNRPRLPVKCSSLRRICTAHYIYLQRSSGESGEPVLLPFSVTKMRFQSKTKQKSGRIQSREKRAKVIRMKRYSFLVCRFFGRLVLHSLTFWSRSFVAQTPRHTNYLTFSQIARKQNLTTLRRMKHGSNECPAHKYAATLYAGCNDDGVMILQ